jgi:hypothetical protein
VNPAFFASENDNFFGELNTDNTLRTGFLHDGHFVNSWALNGLRSVNFPPHALQSPSHNSYSYKGIPEHPINTPFMQKFPAPTIKGLTIEGNQ